MTLLQLFHQHGISTPHALRLRTGISRQYCHALWKGTRRLGANTARTIQEQTGIPLQDLLMADPPPRHP